MTVNSITATAQEQALTALRARNLPVAIAAASESRLGGVLLLVVGPQPATTTAPTSRADVRIVQRFTASSR